ncbi:MAG: hypothetical protein ABSE16_18890 [Verrucomicrobiota bacterium]
MTFPVFLVFMVGGRCKARFWAVPKAPSPLRFAGALQNVARQAFDAKLTAPSWPSSICYPPFCIFFTNPPECATVAYSDWLARDLLAADERE